MLLEVAVTHQTYVISMREIVMRILIVMVILFVDQITVHHHFLIPMIVAQEVSTKWDMVQTQFSLELELWVFWGTQK